MDASGTPGRVNPLPPVTTRWEAPAIRGGAAASPIAPPFVPGTRKELSPSAPMPAAPPVLRAFDSTPAEEEAVELPDPADPVVEMAAPSAAAEPAAAAPAVEPPAAEAPAAPIATSEPLMPWEEFAPPTQEPAASGPAVMGESEDTAPRDLDEWESSIDPNGGQAMPAWGDEEDAADAFAPPPILDDEGAVMPQPERADRSFPLDAFIIPPDVRRLPKGLEHAEELHLEIAEALAKRLEEVAQRLRREGFAGLLHHQAGQEPIDTLLAGVLAGYLSNRTDA